MDGLKIGRTVNLIETEIVGACRELLRNQTPVLAWDWDGTLTANGIYLVPMAPPILKQLVKEYGFRHVIVTGRTSPPLIEGFPLEIENGCPMVIWNAQFGNPYRFKMFVLRSLWNNGRGVLRCYFDNDTHLLETLAKQQTGLPVTNVQHWQYERIIQQIGVFKRIAVRELKNQKNKKA